MDIVVAKPFKMSGQDWGPEYDTAPRGFRPGNTYNVPDAVAKTVIGNGWGAKPGEEPLDVAAGEADLQPDSVRHAINTKS